MQNGKAATKPVSKPRKTSKLPMYVGLQDLADLMGIAKRTVSDWHSRGIVVSGPNSRQFDLIKSMQNYTKHLRDLAIAKEAEGKGPTYTQEKAQTERVTREIKELELRKLRGELLTVQEVAAGWTAFAAIMKITVMTLASKARARLPHLTNHDGEVLREVSRDIMTDLREEIEILVNTGETTIRTPDE